MDDLHEIGVRLAHLRMIQEKVWCKAAGLILIGLLTLPALFRLDRMIGIAAAIVFGGICFYIASETAGAAREQRRIERGLFAANDPRAAGLLLESLECVRGRYRAEVISALVDLLRRLREGDERHFTRSQRNAMRIALMQGERIALSLAILKAYEEIGDYAARGLVRMFADGVLTHTRDRRIQAAARECVVRMNARLEEAERAGLLDPAKVRDEIFAHPTEGVSGALSLSTLLPLDRGGH